MSIASCKKKRTKIKLEEESVLKKTASSPKQRQKGNNLCLQRLLTISRQLVKIVLASLTSL